MNASKKTKRKQKKLKSKHIKVTQDEKSNSKNRKSDKESLMTIIKLQNKLMEMGEKIVNREEEIRHFEQLVVALKLESQDYEKKVREVLKSKSELQVVLNAVNETNTLLVMAMGKILTLHSKFSEFLTQEKINKCTGAGDLIKLIDLCELEYALSQAKGERRRSSVKTGGRPPSSRGKTSSRSRGKSRNKDYPPQPSNKKFKFKNKGNSRSRREQQNLIDDQGSGIASPLKNIRMLDSISDSSSAQKIEKIDTSKNGSQAKFSKGDTSKNFKELIKFVRIGNFGNLKEDPNFDESNPDYEINSSSNQFKQSSDGNKVVSKKDLVKFNLELEKLYRRFSRGQIEELALDPLSPSNLPPSKLVESQSFNLASMRNSETNVDNRRYGGYTTRARNNNPPPPQYLKPSMLMDDQQIIKISERAEEGDSNYNIHNNSSGWNKEQLKGSTEPDGLNNHRSSRKGGRRELPEDELFEYRGRGERAQLDPREINLSGSNQKGKMTLRNIREAQNREVERREKMKEARRNGFQIGSDESRGRHGYLSPRTKGSKKRVTYEGIDDEQYYHFPRNTAPGSTPHHLTAAFDIQSKHRRHSSDMNPSGVNTHQYFSQPSQPAERGHLHTHTAYSKGFLPPNDLYLNNINYQSMDDGRFSMLNTLNSPHDLEIRNYFKQGSQTLTGPSQHNPNHLSSTEGVNLTEFGHQHQQAYSNHSGHFGLPHVPEIGSPGREGNVKNKKNDRRDEVGRGEEDQTTKTLHYINSSRGHHPQVESRKSDQFVLRKKRLENKLSKTERGFKDDPSYSKHNRTLRDPHNRRSSLRVPSTREKAYVYIPGDYSLISSRRRKRKKSKLSYEPKMRRYCKSIIKSKKLFNPRDDYDKATLLMLKKSRDLHIEKGALRRLYQEQRHKTPVRSQKSSLVICKHKNHTDDHYDKYL